MRSYYIVPQGDPIGFLYAACMRERDEGRILEFGLEFTSLEEVFLTVAHMVEPPEQAEAEAMNM